MESFVDDAAVLGDEDEEMSGEEENGEPRYKSNGANGQLDDSSEEEEDDDEEEAKKVAEGFIVDEDEDDDDAARRERRRDKKKRRREEREREDEGLDEEDLELIGIKTQREDTEPKFKRLKRGPREDREERAPGINDIFGASDDEEVDLVDRRERRHDHHEFDDFIEEDVFSDDEEQRQREDEEVARPRRRGMADLSLAADAGLDEQAMDDFRAAFGDGDDYDFALLAEEDADAEEAEREKQLDLKDVFEPSQLAEKLLTDEDNAIKNADEPERHQLARKPYTHIHITDAEFKEEATWIANLLRAKKQISNDLLDPFRKAVAQVLEFMVRESYEVPFIFQNRKDHLIHAVRRQVGRNEDGTPRYEMDANKLLNQNDLWAIFDHDLRFRAFVEKRQQLNKTYNDIKSTSRDFTDPIFDELLPQTATIEELQDLQDYLYFQYSAQIKDVATTALNNGDANGTTAIRKRANASTIYEEIRSSKVYHIVRAFGITADAFAKNTLRDGPKTYTEDPPDTPDNLADQCIDEMFPSGSRAMRAAKGMFAEEMVNSPRMRRMMRRYVYMEAVVDCTRTDKGLRRITEDHPYYEFKYIRHQDLRAIASRPDMFLKMLKAEEEGLVDVKVRLRDPEKLRKELQKFIVSDAYSTLAEAWNEERRNVVATAFDKLVKIMSRNVKENLKNECEDSIALDCREEFSRKLDQAPYQPRGMKKGTTPRVLALSLGGGTSGRDPVYWAYVNDDGRVLENGKFTELAPGNSERGLPDGKDVAAFVEIIRRREPEIIGVSGWSPETRRLAANLEEIVRVHDLQGPSNDEDQDASDPLEVVTVNDEVARLYKSSAKAREQHPGLPEVTLYCVALAKYLQDPLKEYAALGKDLVSITFVPAQNLLPPEKLTKAFETSLIDYVNMVGVELEVASIELATANLLVYVAGLGPRKAQHLLKAYNMNSREFTTREALLASEHAPLTPKVWANSASTLYIRYDISDDAAEFLDNTRIHPEDYDIARKMAADALELDEEDIEAEIRDNGPGAVVKKLIKDEAADRVNDLVLDEYADQLEKDYHAKKRSTLENIRAELNDPYEEIRSPFVIKLSETEIYTMFTHETRDSLQKGMNVPMQVKRVTEVSVEGKLDCGISAYATEGETTDPGVNPRNVYAPHQTIQAHIISIDRKEFTAVVSLREEKTKRPFRRVNTHEYGHDQWDDRQEAADRKMLDQKTDAHGRAVRVVKHPLFKQMGAKAAEEYLGSMNRGDLVIRPSSKGQDHLAVTWKVADGVFQHIDVLELDKENEFTLGKTLRVGGKYNYSDLDELIVLHVKAMSKKVDEMMSNEKFQDKSKSALEEWLTTYANANPKRSMYQFCINRERPGSFHLCFKAGQKAKLTDWQVKVIPHGFQLMNQPYPDMRNLCNGFKRLFENMRDSSGLIQKR